MESAGLVLLLGSGIHIVWGIYRVLNLYEKREATEMHSMASRCIIWSWYTGAIAGSIGAAFALQRIRKNLIYVSGGHRDGPGWLVSDVRSTK